MTEQRLTLNENFTMMCDAEAEPPVTFIEIRGNDIQVNGTGAVTVTLTDLEFSDSGIYSCIATNGNETVKEEFNLIVQGGLLLEMMSVWGWALLEMISV